MYHPRDTPLHSHSLLGDWSCVGFASVQLVQSPQEWEPGAGEDDAVIHRLF